MAASAPPSPPSTSPPTISTTSSKQQTNYTRLCRLLTGIGTRVLRGVFDSLHPPAGLQKHLNSPAVNSQLKTLRGKRILNSQQWHKLYPVSGVPLSTTFDITLLFLLLRNACGLTPPTTGWDAAPSPSDLSREADLIRVKRCRNEITAHSIVAELSDVDFETHWIDIEAALIRLGGKQYEPDIQRLKIESMDPEIEAYLNVLLQSWEESEDKKQDCILQKLNQLSTSLPSKDYQEEVEAGTGLNEQPISFCSLPQKPSHNIISREAEVSQIMDKIDLLRTTYPDEITVTYLSGNPGSGKSELARQIGEKYFGISNSLELPKFVATLNASSLETLTQSYMEMACQLRCNESSITTIITSEIFSQAQKLAPLRALVVPEIERFPSWLMIIDNVEDLQSVSKYIPHAGQKLRRGKGHILVTTQDSQSIPRTDIYSTHFPMSNGMRSDDAVKSLRTISGYSGDEGDTIRFVAEKLDFQPLALACAAVYMQRVRIADPTINWERYLQDIEKGNRELTERVFEKQSSSYGMSMTSAVKMAIEKEIEKSKVMCHSFEFLAAMAPEFILLQHVVNYVMKCMPDEDEKSVAAEIMTSSLIVTSEDKSKPPSVRVHQIVYHVFQSFYLARFNQPVNEFAFVLKVIDIFKYIKDIDDKDSVQYITATTPLVGHFVSFLEKLKDFFERNHILMSSEENMYGVHYQTGKQFTHQYIPIAMFLKDVMFEVFKMQKIDNNSRMILEMSYALVAKNKGNKHPNTGEVLSELGETLRRLKENHLAKKCFEEALDINKSANGCNHSREAANLRGLGNVLVSLGNYKEAKLCHEKALAINESTYGSNHLEVSQNLNNLGTVLSRLGKYERAIECYEKSFDIKQRIFGSHHPEVAIALNNLGTVLRTLGRSQDAKDCFEKALSIDESVYGNNHPHLSTFINNLGSVMRDLGQCEKAKECHEKSLSINEQANGKNHTNVGIDLEKLGLVLHDLGQHHDAKVCYERSLQILETSYGKNHPRVARVLNGLGRLLQEQGHYQAAKVCLDRALAINEKSFSEHHPQVAATLNNLGQVFQGLSEYEQAKAYFERALAINEETFPANHPQIAITLNNLGQVLLKVKKDEEGNCCLKRALAIKERNPDYAFKF